MEPLQHHPPKKAYRQFKSTELALQIMHQDSPAPSPSLLACSLELAWAHSISILWVFPLPLKPGAGIYYFSSLLTPSSALYQHKYKPHILFWTPKFSSGAVTILPGFKILTSPLLHWLWPSSLPVCASISPIWNMGIRGEPTFPGSQGINCVNVCEALGTAPGKGSAPCKRQLLFCHLGNVIKR